MPSLEAQDSSQNEVSTCPHLITEGVTLGLILSDTHLPAGNSLVLKISMASLPASKARVLRLKQGISGKSGSPSPPCITPQMNIRSHETLLPQLFFSSALSHSALPPPSSPRLIPTSSASPAIQWLGQCAWNLDGCDSTSKLDNLGPLSEPLEVSASSPRRPSRRPLPFQALVRSKWGYFSFMSYISSLNLNCPRQTLSSYVCMLQ